MEGEGWERLGRGLGVIVVKEMEGMEWVRVMEGEKEFGGVGLGN